MCYWFRDKRGLNLETIFKLLTGSKDELTYGLLRLKEPSVLLFVEKKIEIWLNQFLIQQWRNMQEKDMCPNPILLLKISIFHLLLLLLIMILMLFLLWRCSFGFWR